jgi:hypothetical protein
MITWLIGLLAARLKLVALLISVLLLIVLAACASLNKAAPRKSEPLRQPLSAESEVVCGDAQAVVLISIPEGMEIHRPDFIQWMNDTGRLN